MRQRKGFVRRRSSVLRGLALREASRSASGFSLLVVSCSAAAVLAACGTAAGPRLSPCSPSDGQDAGALVVYEPFDEQGEPLWRSSAKELAARSDGPGHVRATFGSHEQSTFILHRPVLELPAAPFQAKFTIRLRGWQEVQYVAVGWRGDDRFVHDRVRHVAPGSWLDISVDPASIAFQLTNGWGSEPAVAENLRIIVKGVPGDEAHLDVGPVKLRSSHRFGEFPIRTSECLITRSSLAAWLRASRGRPPRLDPTSFLSADIDPMAVARALRDRNEYRLTSLPPFPGDADGGVPAGARATTTARFRWHALDVVIPLLVAYRLSDEREYLDLARREVVRWLDRNFNRGSADPKYAWYDHGTGNRTLALLLLWDQGVAEGFEVGLMEDLTYALHAHADLLASPSFYLRNQPVRHHNHGIFQDLALLAVVSAAPELAAGRGWQEIAVRRLRDQFDGLSTSEGVSVENSWGYHLGLVSLCDSAVGSLETLGEESEGLSRTCRLMDLFSRSMRYPDGGVPTYGDTHRQGHDRELTAQLKEPAGVQLFAESGYAALWGGPSDRKFQVDIINSSRTLTHKQNDFLSFTLWFEGGEWLIDPGFHSYTDDPHVAFAGGATAHTTILPCGRSFPPEVDVTSLRRGPPGTATVVATYSPRPDLTIERRFDADFDAGSLVVEDVVRGDCGDSASEVWFQLGDDVTTETVGEDLLLRRRGGRGTIRMRLPERAECELYTGQVEPFLAGWYYPSFGEARVTSALRCRLPTEMERWTTSFSFRSGHEPVAPEVRRTVSGGTGSPPQSR